MGLSRLLVTLCAALSCPLAMAAGLPVCFKMTNDSLNRFYVVMADNAQAPVQSSAESQAVRVYEYYVSDYQPVEKRLSIQSSMVGVAGFSIATGAVDWIHAGIVNGDGSVHATSIDNMPLPGSPGESGWVASRNTGVGSPTMHQLQMVPCVVPGTGGG